MFLDTRGQVECRVVINLMCVLFIIDLLRIVYISFLFVDSVGHVIFGTVIQEVKTSNIAREVSGT